MSKFILKFEKDWADEFQCEQFAIYPTKGDALRVVQEIVESNEDQYFGTNEGWESGEIDDVDFSVINVDDDFAEKLLNIFGNRFGTGIL